MLFESAADIPTERLLGINRGVTVVQEPESAQVPVMILSALKRSPAYFVLPLNLIAELLRTPSNPESVAKVK